MAASKFGFSSGSPDRALYNIGQRPPNIAAQLDRSGSLRERMDNSFLPPLPHLSRSNSVLAQGYVSSFFQCLRFDPKVVAAEHKSNRQGDSKRFMNVALGFPADESPIGSSKGKVLSSPSPDDIKRIKAGLRESCIKARERVKIFNEALSVFNKFFPSVPSKKRSRSEGFSSDRSNALLSSERSATGPAFGKMAFQNYTVTGGLEFEQQKSEERLKSSVLNKRTRTSLVDMRMDTRNNASARPPGATDRDREMLRVANGGLVLGEDRIGVDGWEKSKMKKKRSMVKPDISSGLSSPKSIEGYRESKQVLLSKPVNEARSRSDNDPLDVRPGVANGSFGIGKLDGGIQQDGGLGMRSSLSRPDMETSSPPCDRRECAVGSDTERANLRPVNRMSARDEFNSAGPASSTKATASVRGPRSASSVAPKLSPMIQRTSTPGDWELSNCTSKPPNAGGTYNRKRTLAARSPSPPVAHWSGQRPQKISRTARRTNLLPIIPNGDETPPLDNVSDVADEEHGSGFPKRLTCNSPQVKVKCETLSSAVLSESEECAVAEIKSKEKVKQSEATEDTAGPTVQKLSTPVLPPKKNKITNTEDLGDGVRRQGRTGRGSASTRFLLPMAVEKLGNAGTAKQLRSTRHGSDKIETAGRPPTKKLSDRKAYPRQKHTASIATPDLAGSDDGYQELAAAVSASISSAHAFPSLFWRQMEPFLGFISDADIDFLKQQVNSTSVKLAPTSVPSAASVCNTIPNAYGFIDQRDGSGHVSDNIGSEFLSDQFPLDAKDAAVPLYQRLIAALISEEEDDDIGNEDIRLDVYKSVFEAGEQLGPTCFDQIGNLCNGYKMTGKQERDSEINILANSAVNSNFSHHPMHVLPDMSLIPSVIGSELQYESLKISEKILLEAQSIGILLDPMPDVIEVEDDIICEDIIKLDEMHQKQVSTKKGLLGKLLKASLETKEIQEKKFEQRVFEKLVTKAYEKYIRCWGRNATGGKSSSSKMLKQAALASARRTLQLCHKFEETGKICFSEPTFKDLLVLGFSQLADRATDASSTAVQAATLTPQLGQTPEFAANSSDFCQPTTQVSDPTVGKEAAWSSKVYKRELPLDDVGGSRAHSGIGSSLSSSTKGKRSEREGNGQSRDVLSRNGSNKIGRPASNVKGERKLKTKPKQKITQLSVSVNGLISEQPKASSNPVSKLADLTANNTGTKGKDEFNLDVLDDPEVDLQLPGQDLGSWLNIDDDGLQDHDDFMGLEIPMDDLSGLKMMI